MATASRTGLRRRLSPTARHLASLVVYYVLIATAIGIVDRQLPILAAPPAPLARGAASGERLLRELASSPTLPSAASESRARAFLRPVSAMIGAMLLALRVGWVCRISRGGEGCAQCSVHALM